MTTDWSAEEWESALGALLSELSTVQDELLRVLESKRRRMTARDAAGMEELGDEEATLVQRLEQCQQRRQELLSQAQAAGRQGDSLGELVKHAAGDKRDGLGKQIQEAAARMRLLQHESLANWVLAQRTVLHLSQLIEIIATGGRLQPTYGKSNAALARGALVNQEA